MESLGSSREVLFLFLCLMRGMTAPRSLKCSRMSRRSWAWRLARDVTAAKLKERGFTMKNKGKEAMNWAFIKDGVPDAEVFSEGGRSPGGQ